MCVGDSSHERLYATRVPNSLLRCLIKALEISSDSVTFDAATALSALCLAMIKSPNEFGRARCARPSSVQRLCTKNYF